MDLEQLYEIAAKELEINAPRKGLFAQAFAEALGDEGKARALYLKLRVEQLRQALEQKQSEERRKAHEIEIQRVRAERERRATAEDCVALLRGAGYAVYPTSPESWDILTSDGVVARAYGLEALKNRVRDLVDSGSDPIRGPIRGDSVATARARAVDDTASSSHSGGWKDLGAASTKADTVDASGQDGAATSARVERAAHHQTAPHDSLAGAGAKWGLRIVAILGVLLFMAITQGFNGALAGIIKGVLIFTFVGWAWRATDRLSEKTQGR
jgi:hypothetical protein